MEEFLLKRPDEDAIDYEIRLCTAKANKEIDISYEQIKELTESDLTPAQLKKLSVGYQRIYNHDRTRRKQMYDERNHILVISDNHVPFHLPVETFSNYVGITDTLLFNGDVLDCKNISKFPKLYRQSTMEEMIVAREYMMDIIDFIKPKRVVINYGNHELRFQNFLANCVNDDLIELLPKTPLEMIAVDGFHRYDKRTGRKVWYRPLYEVYSNQVEIVYTDSWFYQIGETIFCHPLDFKSGPLKTAEKAVQYFREEGYAFSSLIMAHTHRVGEYTSGGTTFYETGACCDVLSNNYSEGRMTPTQKEGFIYVVQNKDGKLIRKETVLELLN